MYVPAQGVYTLWTCDGYDEHPLVEETVPLNELAIIGTPICSECDREMDNAGAEVAL